MNIIDVSGIERNGKVYNGKTKKYGITYNGYDYIVKFSKNKDDMSVFSEFISSRLISYLGVDCHEVELGIFNGSYVVLVKDFLSNTDYTLHSFKDTKQSSEDTDIGAKEYTYNDVLYLINKHLKMTDRNKRIAIESFWNMFICDAIVGNRDRHWGNWGYIWKDGGYEFAPLYDNGDGLFPDISRVIGEYVDTNSRYNFLYDRVFKFPASLFKIPREDRSYRTNYYEMCSGDYESIEFRNLLVFYRDFISKEFVYKAILSICKDLPIGGMYARFYIEIVMLRYRCIICREDFDTCYTEMEDMLWKL